MTPLLAGRVGLTDGWIPDLGTTSSSSGRPAGLAAAVWRSKGSTRDSRSRRARRPGGHELEDENTSGFQRAFGRGAGGRAQIPAQRSARRSRSARRDARSNVTASVSAPSRRRLSIRRARLDRDGRALPPATRPASSDTRRHPLCADAWRQLCRRSGRGGRRRQFGGPSPGFSRARSPAHARSWGGLRRRVGLSHQRIEPRRT